MARSGFGYRLRLPEFEILEGRIGFKDIEEGVDWQGLMNVPKRESFQTGKVVRRPVEYSAQPDGA